MRKNFKFLGLFALLVIIIAVFVVSFSQSGYAINKGMWEYDVHDGSHIGCKSPGNDCTWSEPIPVS